MELIIILLVPNTIALKLLYKNHLFHSSYFWIRLIQFSSVKDVSVIRGLVRIDAAIRLRAYAHLLMPTLQGRLAKATKIKTKLIWIGNSFNYSQYPSIPACFSDGRQFIPYIVLFKFFIITTLNLRIQYLCV